MTKKKPDFLRDLDTAIMDELTGGGIKGNAAGLVGTLTQIKEIKQLCGLPFCGYMAKLETVRPSGVPDEVTVVFAEDVPYRACNGIEFDVMQEFVEGSRLYSVLLSTREKSGQRYITATRTAVGSVAQMR